ncbi:MAG: hypothetical protein HYV63_19455 [Candidatus Schekmanbacteria bacterium]|nr:hypothetical protein [Candidatus Schekmanbacteria bacterium]
MPPDRIAALPEQEIGVGLLPCRPMAANATSRVLDGTGFFGDNEASAALLVGSWRGAADGGSGDVKVSEVGLVLGEEPPDDVRVGGGSGGASESDGGGFVGE